ncbi:hypothetical protein G5I_08729 [Acromyrmex echinatior]|uniref:Uncharacterized protein n=1 Tax=Acromyrmex echinatior TaxID=103372 RepID=F4WSB0_ACREC|nr:hypothetical protein G5I_08729 [Acromyrmex echinatior]
MCLNLRSWPVFSSLEPKFIPEVDMVFRNLFCSLLLCINLLAVLLLTERLKTDAWELNNSEQAGNSTYRLPITPKLILSNVGCISCGDNFIMAVTRNGKISNMQRNNTFFSSQMATVSQAGGASNFENKNMTSQLVGIPESLIVGNSLVDKVNEEESNKAKRIIEQYCYKQDNLRIISHAGTHRQRDHLRLKTNSAS